MANVVTPLTMVTLAGAGPVPVRNPNGQKNEESRTKN